MSYPIAPERALAEVPVAEITPVAQESRARPERAQATFEMLDAWRGFAALWVVASHAVVWTMTEKFPVMRQSLFYHACALGTFGVPLFFVISGYCISAAATAALSRGHGCGKFLQARARRIFPPYWWTVALGLPLIVGMQWLRSRGLPHNEFLVALPAWKQPALFYVAMATLTQTLAKQRLMFGSYWSLCYEVAFYALVALALGVAFWLQKRAVKRTEGDMGGGVAARDVGARFLLNAMHALTLGVLLWMALSTRPLLYPFDLWAQFGFGALLFDGLQTSRGAPAPRQVWRRPAFLMGVCGVLILAMACRWQFWTPLPGDILNVSRIDEPRRFAVAWGFAMLLACLYPFDARVCRWTLVQPLMRVGRFSYSLYLTHLPVMMLTGPLLLATWKDASSYMWPFAVQIVATVMVARVFFHFAERPYLRAKTSQATSAQATSAQATASQATVGPS